MDVISVQNQSSYTLQRGIIRRAIREVLLGEDIPDIPGVVIVEDDEMIRLNTQFTSHEGTTVVLAFPDEDDPGYLGDVIVNAAQAEREADERGYSFEKEFIHYVIHGTLHLCGYEDHSTTGKRTMRALEQKYLRRIGVE